MRDAEDGDEIVVHPGTYVERITLSGKAITLRSSDGPVVTILDGDAGGTVVTCNSGEGPNTVIEGFTITNGHATQGGGMFIPEQQSDGKQLPLPRKHDRCHRTRRLRRRAVHRAGRPQR